MFTLSHAHFLANIANPEGPTYRDFFATWYALPTTALATLACGAILVLVTTRLFPKPYASPMSRADFGVSELDAAVLIPLGIVVLFLSAAVGASLRQSLEPDAAKEFLRIAAELSSAEERETYLKAALATLSDADKLARTSAYHISGIVRALILIGYAPLVLFLVRREPNRRTASSLLLPDRPGSFIRLVPIFGAWIPLSISLIWLSIAIIAVIAPETTAADYQPETQEVLARLLERSPWQFPAAILTAVVAAPIFEELLFRGAMQGMLRRFVAWPIACGLPLLLFAGIHDVWTSPHIVVPILGLGLVLGWVYERTGNVWHCVVLHAAHNGGTLLVAFLTSADAA